MSVATKSSLQSDTDKGCGCGGTCGCLPAEFTRLRYAYGLRLGAVELSDEQTYLVGKHRFHNARSHGSGVLCGLKVEQFRFSSAATATTVLRVTRGAALDDCGREVIVPVDQCIDVNAWFLKYSAALKLPANTTTVPMRVAVRYRECPGDPAPVPRDPCGCDAGACAYTRVHEGFELRLFAGTLPDCPDDVFPDTARLLQSGGTDSVAPPPGKALKGATDASGSDPTALGVAHLNRELDRLTAAPCPVGKNEWICLADFNATLDSTGVTVTSISEPENDIPGRHVLLSTAALQTMLVGMMGACLANATASTATVNLAVNLLTDSGSVTALAPGTFSATYLKLFQLAGNAWNDVTPTAANSITLSADTTQISVHASGLSAGPYRLSLISPEANPIVDTLMRPLRPMSFSASLQLGTDANGNLTLKLLNI
jgi:hypothetical protein